MTAKQRIHLEAAEAGLQVMDDNHTLWETHAAWVTVHSNLVDIIEEIVHTDAIGVTDNKGAARTKTTIRKDNGKQANIICGPLKTFLLAIPDQTQEGTVHFNASQLTYGSETTLIARWNKIIEVANLPANAAFYTGGYNIVAATTDVLIAGVAEFIAKAPLPKSKRAGKSTAKKSLKTEFKTLATTIGSLETLSNGMLGTEEDFVDTLITALGLDTNGNRKVNAVLSLRDLTTNTPLKKVKVEVTNGTITFTQYSTDLGLVTIKGKPQGNWTATVSLPTYITSTHPDLAFNPELPILKLIIKLAKA